MIKFLSPVAGPSNSVALSTLVLAKGTVPATALECYRAGLLRNSSSRRAMAWVSSR